MKNITILIFAFLSLKSFAGTNVDVLSAEFGVEDEAQRKTLCLTVVRVPKTRELLGIVEEIEDCFYARTAKKSPNHRLTLNMKDLKPVENTSLHSHLQTLDTQLRFYFSRGE